MADYVVEDGKKVLRFDGGETAPVVAIVPLSDGLAVALTPAQLTQLKPPANPTDFPLPAAQLAALIPPANPTTFPLPAAQLDALIPPANPTEFPLPTTQAGWLQGLRDRVIAFVRGSGDFDSNTLRVVVAANQPELATGSPGATMTPIGITGAGNTVIRTPTSGKRLRISSIQLQSPAPTRLRFLANTSPLCDFLEIEVFSGDMPEPIVLPIDAPFRIEVDAATPNAVGGYIVWREV